MTTTRTVHATPRPHAAAALAALLLALPNAARAQRYRVYEWETPMDGWAEPTLWTAGVVKSEGTYDHFGESVREQGVTAHSLEVEYGLTDRATAAVYADFESAPGLGVNYTQTRLNFRYRFSNRYERVFNPALYVEYYVPRGSYSRRNELETRLVLEHDFEDLRLDLNPTVATSFGGDSATRAEGELGTALYYRRFYRFQPGLELYDEFGPLGSSPALERQRHVLFPAANLRFAGAWTWNVGVGFGLTGESDRLTVKSILSYQFQTVRPSQRAQ